MADAQPQPPGPIALSVVSASGDVLLDIDAKTGGSICDLKRVIEESLQLPSKRQKLFLGGEPLEGDACLSDATLKDGDTITLIKGQESTLLHIKLIDDSVQQHGFKKLALQSQPLMNNVSEIVVTVDFWKDQGWGGKRASLFIDLVDPVENSVLVARCNLFGCLRTSEYDDAKHGSSPSRTVGSDEDVVALARPGMIYQLRYWLGGGGGHTIRVKNWKCHVIPPACFDREPHRTEVVDRVGESDREWDRNPKVGPDGHRVLTQQ